MPQPTPVRQPATSIVLDESFAENRVENLRALGAQNTEPPLPRSAFLKNTKTGLILPWSLGLAEQRDIMVNCDAYGNTDPSAWMNTVNEQDYTPEEHAALMQAAYQAVQGHEVYTVPQAVAPVMNEQPELPHGAKHLQEFMADRNAAMVDNLEAALG